MTAQLSRDAQEPGTDRPRVVIVDDTADLRDLLRLALSRGGMEVVGEAADGLAGIEVVAAERPDLVLLDLSMPVMDGLTALPRIRTLVPRSKIVVLSGFDAGQLAERAIDGGADAYIQKGTSLARMLTRLREVLASEEAGALPPPERPVLRAAQVPVRHDALAMAPFGVIEVDAAPPYRVISVNAFAQDLLPARVRPGSPLRSVAPALADVVAGEPSGTGDPFDARLGDRAGEVTVRRTAESLYLYFTPCDDEVGLLRTAIATTAHEIRGPVAVLCALAETITDADVALEDAHQLRLVESIARQARMLDSITADLLTSAQIQRGTLRVAPVVVGPQAVAQAVIDDRHLGRTVRIEALDTTPVLADPLRLGQMLGNLLVNAHKYGRPPVMVRIRPGADPAMLCIDVEDSGDGVPAEFRGQLFREFARASGTTAAGTGLGLHVVQTLAAAQGGRVDYRESGTGGSVFTITLPRAT